MFHFMCILIKKLISDSVIFELDTYTYKEMVICVSDDCKSDSRQGKA